MIAPLVHHISKERPHSGEPVLNNLIGSWCFGGTNWTWTRSYSLVPIGSLHGFLCQEVSYPTLRGGSLQAMDYLL